MLSGFLITGILVDSKGSSNYFGRFYWRRSLRIFPAYYVYLAPLLFVPGLFTGIGRSWFAFYLRNWRGADTASDNLLGHLWSLAVEEQFYIGWSIIVFLAATRRLPHIAVALIALAPAVRAIMGHLGYPGYEILRITPARMDSLLLAHWWRWRSVRPGRESSPLRRGWVHWSVSEELTVMRMFTGPLNINDGIVQVVFLFLIPLLYASILGLCLGIRSGSVAGAVLTNPFFRTVAKYSYAIYLLHLFFGRMVFAVFRVASDQFPAASMLLAVFFIPVAFAVVFGMAAISWRYIEAPALELKDRFFVTGEYVDPRC